LGHQAGCLDPALPLVQVRIGAVAYQCIAAVDHQGREIDVRVEGSDDRHASSHQPPQFTQPVTVGVGIPLADGGSVGSDEDAVQWQGVPHGGQDAVFKRLERSGRNRSRG
jgi:hypothetical protein